ncbi:hypothetical protein [Chitinimonas sp.]|uniref:hypothetical protein n=1 Tax=Chitinimonas sp. TaxID=1934313 RepID=UPI002F95516B
MSPVIGNVINELEQFVPSDEDDNAWLLNKLLCNLSSYPDRELTIEPMFKLMERFPEADFGSPGPLVHEIEAMNGYQSQLLRSLARKPTSLSVWMVNRILNSCETQQNRDKWLEQLKLIAENQDAPYSARQSAEEFLLYQEAQ